MSTEETLIGPRLQVLQQDIESGSTSALELFWQEVTARGTPLIEPIEGDSTHSLVSFVWRAPDETASVSLAGRTRTGDHIYEPMTRMPATDLLYLTIRLRNDLRGEYRLGFGQGEAYERRDPLNPHTQVFPVGEDSFSRDKDFFVSVLELPDAPAQPWLAPRPGVPSGRMEHRRLRSEIMGNERIISVYTPTGYERAGEPYALVVLFDRWVYAEVSALPTTLDNLIAAGAIQPVVVVMVSHISHEARRREQLCNPSFAEFLAQELVPWVRREYHVTTDAERAVVGGQSLGGLTAAYAGLRHPEIFGKILCQSASFQWRPDGDAEIEWLNQQFAASPRLPLSFYLEAGLLEDLGEEDWGTTLLRANRHMREILQAKGYPVHYSEFNGPHVFVCWQGSIADGLIALLGA